MDPLPIVFDNLLRCSILRRTESDPGRTYGKQKHLSMLKKKGGVSAWNQWRSEHPEIIPDLRVANLVGADLSDANMRGADLSEANLGMANLSDADLHGANLRDLKADDKPKMTPAKDPRN
jgi:hypothetical protein